MWLPQSPELVQIKIVCDLLILSIEQKRPNNEIWTTITSGDFTITYHSIE